MAHKILSLVVAAGTSTRLGSKTPKQYLILGQKPLLCWSVDRLRRHPRIAGVRVVIHPDHDDYYASAVGDRPLLSPVHGGMSRQDSVRLGLESLREEKPDFVLIHDAARPFVDEAMLDRIIETLEHADAAIPALAVHDTLKRGQGGKITGTVDRAGLFAAQTPQAFRYKDILKAHLECEAQQLTDDAAVAEAAGMTVTLVPGDDRNRKITTEDDMAYARQWISQFRETRTGSGFDVHRLAPFPPQTAAALRYVSLCGVKVPHDHYLEGHSDADVGLHAAVDAILGAMGEGDIGQHFPPEDPTWRGADSSQFLLRAAELLRERQGTVVNLDITLICESPRITPHRDAMRAKIAELLHLELDRVSVKATTTERLGFTGRKEGIAAQAIATVSLPV